MQSFPAGPHDDDYVGAARLLAEAGIPAPPGPVLLAWWETSRRDLPWRRTRDP